MSKFVAHRVPIVEAPTFSTVRESGPDLNTADMDNRDEKVKKEIEAEEEVARKKDVEKKEKEEAIAEQMMLRERRLHRIDQLYEGAHETVFRYMLFEYYRRSLNLDEKFVQEKSGLLRSHLNDFLSEQGGYNLLKDRSLNDYLAEMKRVCDRIVTQSMNRIVREVNETETDPNDIDFALKEEEKEELDRELEDLSVDEITDLVKKKVLQVVIDEKKTAMKQEEELQATEDEIAQDTSVEDEKDLQEALSLINAFQHPVKEYTLFGAIMRRSYQQLLENDESFRDPMNDDEHFDDSVDDDIEFHDDFDENIPEDQPTFDEKESIPDKAMAEAIAVYTTYELFHTLGIMKLSQGEIKALAESIAYNLK